MRAYLIPPVLACLLALAPSYFGGAASPLECEGEGCSAVSLTFDEAKGRYRAQNNSPDRWVRVAASNLADASSACLAPGKDGHLALKRIVGAYRADYSEPRCGAPEVGE